MPSPHESGFRRKNNGLTEGSLHALSSRVRFQKEEQWSDRSLHALSSRVRFQKEEQWSDREVPACPLLTSQVSERRTMV